LRRIDSCIIQFKAQGPSRTCNESKEKEEEEVPLFPGLFHRGDGEGKLDLAKKATVEAFKKGV